MCFAWVHLLAVFSQMTQLLPFTRCWEDRDYPEAVERMTRKRMILWLKELELPVDCPTCDKKLALLHF